jgi:hypothetical protein
MAINNNTGAADVDMSVGGAYSTGPAEGVYHIQVTETGKDESKGENGKPKRPLVTLTLTITAKDKVNASKKGKKLMTDRTYFPCGADDKDKVKTMLGMLKRKLYDGFGIAWPKESKKFDPRIFANKEAFVYLAKGKPNPDTGEQRVEVQAYALTPDKLPKPAQAWLEAAKKGETPAADAE